MPNRQPKTRWDFEVVRKPIIPKIKHIPRREVLSADLPLLKKYPQKAKPKSSFVSSAPTYSTMPESRVLRSKSYKPLMAFVGFAVIVVMLVQAAAYFSNAKSDSKQILGVATSAYADLDSAATGLKSQNFADAENLFQSAQSSLSQAGHDLDKYWLLTKVIPQARSADKLLEAAEALAAGGKSLSSALALFNELKVDSSGVQTKNFSQVLTESKTKLDDSLANLEKANNLFGQATSLPDEYKPKIAEAKIQVATLTNILTGMVQVEDLYLSLLGKQTKTYFLAFQNYDELRATGGFIGTYGVLKISDGQIKEMKIESIYNLDGSIYNLPAAPGPFQPEIAKWGTRDANWFADFPTSSKKILMFYEKGKETADGVIAITPKFFVDLLKITGPLEMPDYGVTLTSDNFQEVVQLKTSVEYDKKLNQPKKMLADFAPLMLNRLQTLTQQQWLQVLQIFNDNLFGKNLLLYSTDPATQAKIESAGVSGKILESDSDYLNIVNTNRGGTKTDLEIDQRVDLTSKLLSDGSIQNSLVITRRNSAQQPNTDFMRIMVPLGAQLLSAEGFEDRAQFSSVADGIPTDPELADWDKGQYAAANTFQRIESGKTEFTGWITVPAVATRTIKLSYILPNKISVSAVNPTGSYSLIFQKQPGSTDTRFDFRLDLGSFNPVWSSPDLTITNQRATISTVLTRDRQWSVVISE